MFQGRLDLSQYQWREVDDEADTSYLIHHDYTILGYNEAAGMLDMIVHWGADGGHCTIHRHMATTTCFVMEGEQHLYDFDKDGKLAAEPRIRRAGDYGLSLGEERRTWKEVAHKAVWRCSVRTTVMVCSMSF